MRHAIAFGLLVIASSFGGCTVYEEPARPPRMVPASGPPPAPPPAAEPPPPLAAPPLTTAQAIDLISNARCDHEQGCNRIGPYSTYMTRDHCMNVMHNDSDYTLNSCRYVDHTKLDQCLFAVRNDACRGPTARLERLSRFVECRPASLCTD